MYKRSRNVAAVTALLALWLAPSMAFAEGQAEGAAADAPMEITWQLREETSYAAQVAEEIFNVRILGNGIWNNDREKNRPDVRSRRGARRSSRPATTSSTTATG